jgi:hypothetical protein
MLFCHTLGGTKLESFNIKLILKVFRIFILLVTCMLLDGLTKYSRAFPQPLFLTLFLRLVQTKSKFCNLFVLCYVVYMTLNCFLSR